ncbi:polysaccharide biosynthesis protein [Aquipuribacter sp. MA13-13]|uniref:polysaccharide biosynthesis protein n=1 Tax=Aquipuribacter sp. MA13-13 TaxID=3440840 RepID=UPI003EE9C565
MPPATDDIRLPAGESHGEDARRGSTFVRWWTGPTKAGLDAVVLIGATLLTVTARLDLTASRYVDPVGLLWYLVVVVAVLLAVGTAVVYRGQYRYGSFEEISVLAIVVGVSAVAGLAFAVLVPGADGLRVVPLSVPVVSAALSLIGMAGLRWIGRRAIDAQTAPADDVERVLVLGAGESGYQIIRAMLKDPSSPFRPVGLVEDDLNKKNLRIEGVRVLGPSDQLPELARRTGATTLILAVRTANAADVRTLAASARAAGLRLLSVPSTSKMLGSELGLGDIRALTVEDLLGRHQISTDVHEIAAYLTGRRILVTGAGGSIGSELCRQIHAFQPSALIMLERDESALHAVQLSIEGHALLDSADLVLADIRDRRRLDEVFAEQKPDVVFHAAALKHLPLVEANPGEALQSNVWGTLNVLDAAHRNGVQRFINISTDKAADPTSVLGWTKRIAERLTAQYAEDGSLYMSVRFGNVLGSRGSVLHTFADQVARGGPITITDSRVTRYFMTVPEAVELVIQCGAIGSAGESLVLDMGEPVLIAELAMRIADLAGATVEMVETGLRPGEKLHEDLIGADEVGTRRAHPLITHVPVPPLPPQLVQGVDPWRPRAQVVADLRALSEHGVTVPPSQVPVGPGSPTTAPPTTAPPTPAPPTPVPPAGVPGPLR